MKKSILNFLMMSILISLIGAIALGTLEYLIGSTVLFIVCIGFVFISAIAIIPFQIMKAINKQRPKFEICDACETVMTINEYYAGAGECASCWLKEIDEDIANEGKPETSEPINFKPNYYKRHNL
jgi:hypothetical protein